MWMMESTTLVKNLDGLNKESVEIQAFLLVL